MIPPKHAWDICRLTLGAAREWAEGVTMGNARVTTSHALQVAPLQRRKAACSRPSMPNAGQGETKKACFHDEASMVASTERQ
eukprot:15431245-Alexandrium_andersonii.AAC.1